MTPEQVQRVINALRQSSMVLEGCALEADKDSVKDALRALAARNRELLAEVGDAVPNTKMEVGFL